jgi:hypothetical protein
MPALSAPAPVQGNRMADLAGALGSFGSGVRAFGDAYAAHQKNATKGDSDRLAYLKAINTPDAFREKVLSGEIPRFADPHVQLKSDITFGTYAASNLQKEYQEKLATGELRPEDAAGWLTQRRDTAFQDPNFAGNEGRLRGYGDAWNSLYADAQHRAMGAQVKALDDKRNVGANQRVEMDMDNLFSKVPPQEAWARMNATKQAVMKDFYLTPKEADDYIWRDLSRRVEKDPNWAVEFASAKRQGMNPGDGIVSAIGDHPERADQLSSWKKTQTKFNVTAAKDTAEKTIAAADYKALLAGDGSFHNITDRTYTNPVDDSQETVTREKRQNAAIARFNTDSANAARGNQETPRQTFEREAQVFVDNNVKNPAWKSEVEDAVNLANPRSLSDPSQVARLGQAYNRYRAIDDRSPAYAKAHFSEQARTFYQTARVLQDGVLNPDGSRMTDVQALSSARGAEDADTPERQEQFRKTIQAVEQNVSSLANPHSTFAALFNGSFGLDTANASNRADVAHDIQKLATALVRTGRMDGTQAVEAAVKHLSQTGKVQGGIWTRNTSDNGFDYGQVSSRLITDYVKSPLGQAMGYRPGDLKVWAHDDGRYELVSSLGLPVMGGSFMSRQDMVDVQHRINSDNAAHTLRVQHANQMDAETRDKRLQRAGEKVFGPANDAAYSALISGQGGVNPNSAVGREIIRRYKERHPEVK